MMNMKRQISVSIFLAILVIILAWLYIKFNNETKPREDVITTENEISKEPSITISQEQISAAYYIKQESGRLVVYEGKSNAKFQFIELFQSLPLGEGGRAQRGRMRVKLILICCKLYLNWCKVDPHQSKIKDF